MKIPGTGRIGRGDPRSVEATSLPTANPIPLSSQGRTTPATINTRDTKVLVVETLAALGFPPPRGVRDTGPAMV